MKQFYYDTLLDEENICNLLKERDVIEKAIRAKKKLVVYGPRNFGKTSLVKNVVLSNFHKKHPHGFVFFADLMEVKSLESIDHRISKGFESSFRRSFPGKSFMEGVGKFLAGLRPQITIDPQNGSPSLSITSEVGRKHISVDEIFETISKIAKERDTIIVLDEFQDIAFVEEAQGIFRNIFQNIKDLPLIVMGSKRHILANMLANPDAPLAMFGEDVEFGPISYDEYHAYIMERFGTRKLKMTPDDSKYLQDALCRVPEAINIVCAEMMENLSDVSTGKNEIALAIQNVVAKRQSRYEEYLSYFSENEESVLTAIAKTSPVKHPNGKAFLKMLKPTSRMVGILVGQLYDRSVIDKKDDGFYVTDPLLTFYLKNYR